MHRAFGVQGVYVLLYEVIIHTNFKKMEKVARHIRLPIKTLQKVYKLEIFRCLTGWSQKMFRPTEVKELECFMAPNKILWPGMHVKK